MAHPSKFVMPPLSYRKRVISTCGPFVAMILRHQFHTPAPPSCLIRDAASRPFAVHPSTPLLPWLFPAPARQLAERPSSQSNRLESISRRFVAPRVAVGRVTVMTLHPPFTVSLSVFPALNVGDVHAGIATASPVLGFRPVRADLLPVPKVPNPAIRTSSPPARVSPMISNTLSTASPAASLPRPVPRRQPVGHFRLVHPFSIPIAKSRTSITRTASRRSTAAPEETVHQGRMRFPYRPSRRPAIRPASTSSTARRGARFLRRPRCCRAGEPGSTPKSTTRRSATPSGSGAERHVTDSNICFHPFSWSRLCVFLGPRAWKTIRQERVERRCWP